MIFTNHNKNPERTLPPLHQAPLSRHLALTFSTALLLTATTLATLTAAHADPTPAPPAEAATPADTFSPVETLLFMTDHLKSLPPRATVLHYHFAKTGSYEAGYEDDVTLSIDAATKGEDGRNAKLDFLTGDHKAELPPVAAAHGNPVILGFLERDIREMKRITGGSPDYYRKRLRLAMVDAKEVKPVQVKWGSKSIKADEMTLDPYKDDPVRSRFARYANKLYTFVLSDQVPGGVVSLKTAMRDGSNTGKIMIEENLSLVESK